ncbi:MAG: hypothetical protein R6W90_08430 [Ignavibacteriaceae bacterium]
MKTIGITFLLAAAVFFTQALLYAQGVAVNTSGNPADASAILDVSSTTQGVLIPRMTEAQRTGISSPATGLLVYQADGTAGFYYNAGTPESPNWISLSTNAALNSSAWSTTGNSGTTAGTNFIGTTDAQALVVKTNGSEASNERARFLSTGHVVVNNTTARSGDLFSVYGSGTAGAINSGINFNFPISGYSAGIYAGFYGENNGGGQGVLGFNSSTGTGVYGINTTGSGTGVTGLNQGSGIAVGAHSISGTGVNGTSNSASSPGIRGASQNTNGTGIVALGNNITSAITRGGGSGLAANGTLAGIYSVGTNTFSGVGLIGGGNGITNPSNPGIGAGVIGHGESFGVIGYAGSSESALANDKWGGYFDYQNSANGWTLVGGRSGNTDYGILSNGTKSTIITDISGTNRVLFCPEAPEVLFEDYGTGTLVNGYARIDIDPVFSGTIYVDNNKPLKVFIQLEGECNGVYVTNKSVSGFDVYELQSGTSNISFSWHIVANRADAHDESGNVTSRFADLRFPAAPDKPKFSKMKTDKAESLPEFKTPELKNNVIQD